MNITAYDLAESFIGLTEEPGDKRNNAAIMWMLTIDSAWPTTDEVPWCSAFVNTIAKMLRLPRSKSLAARSWLSVGEPIPLEFCERGFDVVILSRGTNPEQGHVGFYVRHNSTHVWLLGGNQGNAVTIAPFERSRVVECRRLWEKA
jgi:uncharacterized protein (TIGR02594 family)